MFAPKSRDLKKDTIAEYLQCNYICFNFKKIYLKNFKLLYNTIIAFFYVAVCSLNLHLFFLNFNTTNRN